MKNSGNHYPAHPGVRALLRHCMLPESSLVFKTQTLLFGLLPNIVSVRLLPFFAHFSASRNQ